MRPPVSRLVLLAALAGAAAVLAAAAVKLKDPLLERWRISRLEAGDPGERARSVEWLRLRGSARALPALLAALEEDARRAEAEIGQRLRALATGSLSVDPSRFPVEAAILEITDRSPADGSRALASETLRAGSAGWTVRATLARLGSRAEPAVPDLIRMLEGGSDFAWEVVPGILGRIGPAARPALPLVLERIERGDAGSVVLARVAGNIAAGPDVPAILALLESTEPFIRRAALWAIAQMGQGADGAVPALEACLHDADDEIRTLAALALGSVGETGFSGLQVK